ncbi:hypothetical protein HY639_05045 [Candidatus Woesearchaeota archaeon]|nr:hypothetical protein [Candidatus Woesearchaeota archaeon]
MKKGVFFSLGFALIILGILGSVVLIVSTKEAAFKQQTIGDYAYQLVNHYYAIELERHTLMQAGRFSLLAALNDSLSRGISTDCPLHDGVAIWSQCFPDDTVVKTALEDAATRLFPHFQNSSLYNPENNLFELVLQEDALLLTNLPRVQIKYDVENQAPPTAGAPYHAVSPVIVQSSLLPVTTGPCPPPQRPLPKHYLDAFARYQHAIARAAQRYAVEPALLAALMTKETSFGTNPQADRADEYGKPLRDGIPDYIAGCRVCVIEGCLDHPTVDDPSKNTWRAPPNKPDHNIICAAERIAAYKEKIASGVPFGCLADSRYNGQTEELLIKKLACTYNSGPAKYSYADEVYAFYLQWKDVLCARNQVSGAYLALSQMSGSNVTPVPQPVFPRHTTYSVAPAFSSSLPFNMSLIHAVVSHAKKIQACDWSNSTLCLANVSFLESSCHKNLTSLDRTKPVVFCVPIPSSQLHGRSFYLRFALMLPVPKPLVTTENK